MRAINLHAMTSHRNSPFLYTEFSPFYNVDFSFTLECLVLVGHERVPLELDIITEECNT